MGPIYYSAADFVGAFQALLPRGRVWSRDPDATVTQLLKGLAPTFERQTARANVLLIDAFPKTTYELLPEWEETLGLPDPCAGENPTVQARRAQVIARLTRLGGQSAAYFQALARALGYTITIQNYAPFRIGRSFIGDSLNDQDWAHTWAVRSPLNTIEYFRAGQSAIGEPLSSWGNAVLECEISAYAPAHTVLLFQYV